MIWWMYGGYVWLTNAVAPDRAGRRLLLLGGMGAFLVLALAIPALAGMFAWTTPRLVDDSGFQIAPTHFVERHGLVVIVAIGESIVALGIGAEKARRRSVAGAGGQPRPRAERAGGWGLTDRR